MRGALYGSLVIVYLFLGGAAAGALFVMSAWSFAFRRSENPARLLTAFESLRRRTYTVGFLLLAFAMICLLGDLGNPGRALMVFFLPHPTVITFGAYTLAIEALLAALLLAASLPNSPLALRGRWLDIVEALCCIGALATMAYTGIFLFQGSIPFWNHWSIIVLFVFSSLSSGVSVVLLIDWFTQGQSLLLRATKPLQICHVACLAAEVVFLTLFVNAAFRNPLADASLNLLMEPEMLAIAGVGVIGMGIALPITLETYSITRKECRAIPVSDFICLLGGLCLRYCLITCGVH
ncbi:MULTISPECIES: NrfD/PsrC family molybdoenzyme membrane anchor subunit [Gordonibacter]|uniref:NrfD/PsrC family molybdoenzyme membrane anchor subunit n=1 Tax=Gordonibacter TaxID=644652 RepID=UPI001DBC8F03|nr:MULTISPECIES: NrfD/PsrC family molybdoenzyme membrane anchor subunit [Gordonibacter]MDN4508359.1 polysulfide reductase NrfD [Gordonibacter sp. RACS_AR49]HJF62250.1 polysulfide reductase NrfD [Gordonibacter urolithinfaciens]